MIIYYTTYALNIYNIYIEGDTGVYLVISVYV